MPLQFEEDNSEVPILWYPDGRVGAALPWTEIEKHAHGLTSAGWLLFRQVLEDVLQKDRGLQRPENRAELFAQARRQMLQEAARSRVDATGLYEGMQDKAPFDPRLKGWEKTWLDWVEGWLIATEGEGKFLDPGPAQAKTMMQNRVADARKRVENGDNAALACYEIYDQYIALVYGVQQAEAARQENRKEREHQKARASRPRAPRRLKVIQTFFDAAVRKTPHGPAGSYLAIVSRLPRTKPDSPNACTPEGPGFVWCCDGLIFECDGHGTENKLSVQSGKRYFCRAKKVLHLTG